MDFLKQLRDGQSLSQSEAYECLLSIFSGSWSDDAIQELLSLLHQKGETVDEIVGFARAMREKMVTVSLSGPAMDICGTGGSGKDRFNISTVVAFILAASGVGVAKHGNRGSRKRNGSFDFLEALGISFELSVEEIEAQFERTSLCFLFARSHHPAVKSVAQARKQLGHRSIFNCLGPLCNPAGVSHQIIGCIDEELAEKIAQTAQLLGTEKTAVIVGGGGIDELSAALPSRVIEVTPAGLEMYDVDPGTILPQVFSEDELVGGDASENATLFMTLLADKQWDHPILEMAALNAGLAFFVGGYAADIDSGYRRAKEVLASGAVLELVKGLSST